jgi:hypothetical protein
MTGRDNKARLKSLLEARPEQASHRAKSATPPPRQPRYRREPRRRAAKLIEDVTQLCRCHIGGAWLGDEQLTSDRLLRPRGSDGRDDSQDKYRHAHHFEQSHVHLPSVKREENASSQARLVRAHDSGW